MQLSEEQARAIIQRLESTAANRQPCPVCGNTHWTLNNKIFEIIKFLVYNKTYEFRRTIRRFYSRQN